MRATVWSLLFGVLASLAARGGEVRVSGQVTLDGKKPRQPVRLLVLVSRTGQRDGRAERSDIVTDDRGRFAAVLLLEPGDLLVVAARNSLVPDGRMPVVLAGRKSVVIAEEREMDLSVALTRVGGRRVQIVVTDQSGNRAANLPLRCRSFWREGGRRAMAEESLLASNQEGLLLVRCLPEDDREWEIACQESDVDGASYSGTLRFTADELNDTAGGDFRLSAQRSNLSLKVEVCWDPAFSDKPLAGELWGGCLSVRDVAHSRRPLNRLGEIWLYELPPGERVLDLAQDYRKSFRITGGTERLTVPARQAWPTRHMVTLEPAVRVEARYVLSDGGTGRPLAGVPVSSSVGAAESDELGRVVLNVWPGEIIRVASERYFPVELKAPDKSEILATKVKLRPYPVLKGRMTELGSGQPVELGEIELRPQGSKTVKSVSTDQVGRFSEIVAPGEYDVLVARRYIERWPMHHGIRLAVPPDLPLVVLQRFRLTIGEDDMEKNFELPPLTRLTVEAEVPPRLQKELDGMRPSISLVAADTQTIICRFSDEAGARVAYAKYGRYRVLVTAGEGQGFLSEPGVLERSQESMTVKVTGWRPIQVAPRGAFSFAAPDPGALPP